MSSQNTYNALLNRGIESNIAARLITDGYTLQKLQLKTRVELEELRIPEDQIGGLLDKSRPLIPDQTFFQILHDSKWVCCICRDTSRGIIIHHIIEWSKSRSHDYDNLSLLCLLHHDEAHTTRGLTLMLSPHRIREARNTWYEKVKASDQKIIAPPISLQTNIDLIPIQRSVTVENIQQFVDEIKPNTTIHLKFGIYNLSDITKYRGNEFIKWGKEYDGYEPHIIGINNLKLIGEPGTQILIDPSYAWVLHFRDCKDITIENIISGHTKPGYCTGGVFKFENCKKINIQLCDLYGCGTYGLNSSNSEDFTINKTTIRECTYGIAQFFNSKNILLRNCQFRDCQQFDLITIRDYCTNINFLQCEFSNNKTSKEYGNFNHFFDIDLTCEKIIIEYSNLYNNEVSHWTNTQNVIVSRHNNYIDNSFTLPEDDWYYNEHDED